MKPKILELQEQWADEVYGLICQAIDDEAQNSKISVPTGIGQTVIFSHALNRLNQQYHVVLAVPPLIKEQYEKTAQDLEYDIEFTLLTHYELRMQIDTPDVCMYISPSPRPYESHFLTMRIC